MGSTWYGFYIRDSRMLHPQGRAAVSDSRAPLLLIERVLPEKIGPEDLDDFLADLEMLTSPGGQERTEAEYTALLKRAGFKLERTIPTPTPVKILESVPV